MKMAKNNISILETDRCTGCGVCANCCPTEAITLGEDSEGFRKPYVNEVACVECKACIRSCPVLTLKKYNEMKPDIYAVRAEDSIRAVSSSGGVFSLLAEYVLNNAGYVCGAAFDENIKLKHIMISDDSELYRLRGSKYVQSDTGDIYNQVKDKIKEGRMVLFVGTPCQVAAVKNYVGNNDKFYTVDILCHGVPSQRSLDKYLKEISNGKKIINVEFRNKRNGWSCEHILISYEDGTEYNKSMKEGNAYIKAFLSNMMLRKSCENCPFSEFPRHGDLSMGDFWGISKFDETQNDGKGTSVVFVNNAAGARLVNDVISKNSVIKKFGFSDNMPNRIKSFLKANSKREQFLDNLKNHNFSEAMDLTMKNKFDIGLVSNYCAVNFGGSLTQFALYSTLKDMGYTVLMIERPKSAPGKVLTNFRSICYDKWPYPDYSLAKQYLTKEDMRELNNYCDTFIVGSDQLFQNTLFNLLGGIYTLDWVENTKKKIAYAASFGFDYVWGDRKQIAEMGYFMQQFDAFSVREDSGIRVAKDYFGVDAVQVLDPVFLCDLKHYDELIAHSHRDIKDNYISSYILDPTDEKIKMLEILHDSLKMRVEVFSEMGNHRQELFSMFDYECLKVEGRLQSIKNASFFLCDSFHGTCLAIIYNIPFVCVINKKRGGARFHSLLKYFGLEDRMVETLEEFKSRFGSLRTIDFTYANEKLKQGREFGLAWLKNALQKERKKGASIYDILIDRLAERDQQIEILRKLVRRLYSDRMLIPFADSIDDYLTSLKANKDRCIYIVAVKDTAGLSVTEDMALKLQECVGIKQNMFQKHWKSYIAVINGEKIVYEQISDEKIEKSLLVEGFEIKVTSAAFNVGNVAKIIVNGVDYAINKRGFNIVAIDKSDGIVCDSAYIDMHLKKYEFGHKDTL